MEGSTSEVANLPKEQEETNSNNEALETNKEPETFSVNKDEKCSDSDANSEDLSSNDEQNNVNSGSSSQFYESSDSKLDYAVKTDDNDTLSDIDDIKTDTASADSEDSALGSLPPDNAPNEISEREEAQEPDRSDGSDSGIGSETPEDAKIPSFLTLPCTSGLSNDKIESDGQINIETQPSNNNVADKTDDLKSTAQITQPQKSNLKRKVECDNEQPQTKRKKENIKFDHVTVYYFPRTQGFSCVPSQGGSTLGMEWEHSHIQNFTITEHALEQRRLHRQILQQLKSERHSLQGVSLSSSEDSDTEEEASDISESELDLDSYYFLQPVPTRQRRALLRAAGVRKIEGYEKDECRDIRTSREFCGCACKGTCNPETCSCSLAGIKCQVDRLNFPCGCTRDGCSNTTGRIEFNPVRVRTHFIHTLMRLGLEKKNEEEAAKKQWAAHNASSVATCATNTSYDRDRCHSHEDGLLRDVSLTPRVEVESCVNNGSFSNVHCDMNASVAQTNMANSMTYNYRNEDCSQKSVNENNIMHFDRNSHHTHAQAYTNNILQGKGPPYSTANAMSFDTMSNNMQRFPCDLNYTYEQHADSNPYKEAQSYSATSFEEFAHNSQMSMFSHYGHMYVPEYLHKPSTSMHDHSSVQYHAMTQQSHYDMYKNSSGCVDAENKDSHYTTLMTLPYQNSNKMQTLENDENWYSHSSVAGGELGQGEHTQDAEPPPAQAAPAQPAPDTAAEPTENFGELIKKTMVESVTV